MLQNQQKHDLQKPNESISNTLQSTGKWNLVYPIALHHQLLIFRSGY